MARAVLLSVLLAGLLAGCGADAPPPAAPEAVAVAAAGPVEATDGRLGAATATDPAGARTLSPGGRPDLRDAGEAPRRDGVGAGAACADTELTPTAATLGAAAAATLCLLNGERADRGLAPLTTEPRLTAAADAYAADLVAGGYFSHTGRDGSRSVDRLRRAGYVPDDRAWRVGENLAWGTGALATPAAIVQAWMNSPGHRENILDPAYREIGVGIATGNPARPDGAGATYATSFGAIEAQRRRAARSDRRAARRRGDARRARASREPRRGKRGARSRGPRARIAA